MGYHRPDFYLVFSGVYVKRLKIKNANHITSKIIVTILMYLNTFLPFSPFSSQKKLNKP